MPPLQLLLVLPALLFRQHVADARLLFRLPALLFRLRLLWLCGDAGCPRLPVTADAGEADETVEGGGGWVASGDGCGGRLLCNGVAAKPGCGQPANGDEEPPCEELRKRNDISITI